MRSSQSASPSDTRRRHKRICLPPSTLKKSIEVYRIGLEDIPERNSQRRSIRDEVNGLLISFAAFHVALKVSMDLGSTVLLDNEVRWCLSVPVRLFLWNAFRTTGISLIVRIARRPFFVNISSFTSHNMKYFAMRHMERRLDISCS